MLTPFHSATPAEHWKAGPILSEKMIRRQEGGKGCPKNLYLCAAMKITFLGTGTSQGVPVIACDCEVCRSQDSKDKRLRSSLYLEAGGTHLVIDAGPDFRQQLLRENLRRLDGILLTHGHKDHIAGLDDVRAFNYIQKKAVDIFAQQRVQEQIKKEFAYAFAEDRYPGVPEFHLNTIGDEPFRVNGLEVIPVEALHYRLPVLGFRISDMAYLTDLSHINEKEKTKLYGLKVVIVAALRKKPHYSHFNLDQALHLIDELKPQQAWLTHISHMMGCHAEVETELPENVRLAYDGLTIEI